MSYPGYVVHPSVTATIQPIPRRDGYFASPAIAIATLAIEWNEAAQSQVGGKYRPGTGEVHSHSTIQAFDTYVSTAGLSGMQFSITGGMVLDTWVDYTSGAQSHGLLFPDGSPGAAAVVATQIGNDSTLQHYRLVLRRGFPAGGSYSPTTNYTYVDFMYNSSGDNDAHYRFVMQYGRPFQLWYADTGGDWQFAQQVTGMGRSEEWFAKHDILELHMLPDYEQNVFALELGDGKYLRHSPPQGKTLPAFGKLRVQHAGGNGAFNVYPLTHVPVTVTSTPVDLGISINLGSAYVKPNATVKTNNTILGIALATTGSKVKYTVTGTPSNTNAPAKIADATLIVPPIIQNYVTGGANPDNQQNLLTMRVEETEVLDDMRRLVYCDALVTANNWQGQYTGAYRNQAITISASNLGYTSTRLTGIAGIGHEGLQLLRQDPMRTLTVPCSDKRVVMGADPSQPVPIGYRLVLDGWGLYPAIGFLCLLGNIDVSRFSSDTHLQGPYGPITDTSYSDPILPRGTGNNPRFSFAPEVSPWMALQTLITDQGMPVSDGMGGTYNVPYYFGFNPAGNIVFQPFDPRTENATACYEGDPAGGYFQAHQAITSGGTPPWMGLPILPITGGPFQVSNSCHQERSELNFQGKNPFTQQLEQVHLPTSPRVQEDIGFRSAWCERNQRWFGQYLLDVAQAGLTQASLPVQIASIPTLFHPGIHVSQTIYVYDANVLGPSPVKMYITQGRHLYSKTEGISHLIARNVLSPG